MTKKANEHLDKALTQDQKDEMIQQVAYHYSKILETLQVDWKNDHNCADTPRRFAKMYVNELYAGRFTNPPAITQFENASDYDQLIVVGPIEVKSMCSHHAMPFEGYAYIGVLPNIGKDSTVIGLSKYARIVDWFARRPQIQEELTSQILSFIVDTTNPRAAGVRITSKHLCMSHRGVKQSNSVMTTTKMYGDLLTNHSLKQEFLMECQSLEKAV